MARLAVCQLPLAEAIENFGRYRQESDAWMNFFEKDIYGRVTYRAFRKASNQYWNAVDQLASLQRYEESLWALVGQIEGEMAGYAALQADGFHVATNRELYADEGPVAVMLKVVGPAQGEDVLLEHEIRIQESVRCQPEPPAEAAASEEPFVAGAAPHGAGRCCGAIAVGPDHHRGVRQVQRSQK